MRCYSLFILLFFNVVLTQAQKTAYVSSLWAKLGNKKDTVYIKTLINLGAYYLQENRYDSIRFYNKAALALSEKLNYHKGMSLALCGLGVADYRNAHYATALDYYQQAIVYAKKNNDVLTVAINTSNIGELNIILNNYDLGFQQLKEAESVFIRLNDSVNLVSLHSRLAQLYRMKDDTANSNLCLKKALVGCSTLLAKPQLPIQDKINLQMLMRHIMYSQTEVLRENNQPEAALAIFKQLRDDMKDIPGGRERVIHEFKTAETYYEIKKYPEALYYCNSTLALLAKDSIADVFFFAYELRSQVYESMGQMSKALSDFKMAKQFSDSLFNKEMLNKTYELLGKQEAELKNEQIRYLNKQKTLYKVLVGIAALAAMGTAFALLMVYRSRKLQRKLLIQQNQMNLSQKELENNRLQLQLFEQEQAALRAQMNPHFIFNSLNSIQHYVIGRDIQGANKYISMLGSLIRLTLENAAKPTIPLSEELAYLEKYLALERMRMQDDFDYRISLAPGLNTDEYAILPMLLQPFLENALKHGIGYLKDRRGLVELAIEPVLGALQYTITDNGVGRKLTAQYKKNRLQSTHQSKGIELSEKRLAQLKKGEVPATLTIIDLSDSEGNPNGTQVVIVVPD
jgi:Histidine kinase